MIRVAPVSSSACRPCSSRHRRRNWRVRMFTACCAPARPWHSTTEIHMFTVTCAPAVAEHPRRMGSLNPIGRPGDIVPMSHTASERIAKQASSQASHRQIWPLPHTSGRAMLEFFCLHGECSTGRESLSFQEFAEAISRAWAVSTERDHVRRCCVCLIRTRITPDHTVLRVRTTECVCVHSRIARCAARECGGFLWRSRPIYVSLAAAPNSSALAAGPHFGCAAGAYVYVRPHVCVHPLVPSGSHHTHTRHTPHATAAQVQLAAKPATADRFMDHDDPGAHALVPTLARTD